MSVAVTVIFEIPIFRSAAAILARLGSDRMKLTAHAAYVIRAVFYTLIPDAAPALVLLCEPLHGITYACGKASQIAIMAAHASKRDQVGTVKLVLVS
jgi:hypothetical protein